MCVLHKALFSNKENISLYNNYTTITSYLNLLKCKVNKSSLYCMMFVLQMKVVYIV